jgi:glycine cleavage system H protein
MKELSELTLPENLRYSKDHEWASTLGDLIRVGISDYAQDQLGDVVYVELPEVGAMVKKGDVFGSVESVKTVSELFIPFSGEVVEVNEELEASPELINESPYKEGWMVVIKANDPEEVSALMESGAYKDFLSGLE